MKTQCISRLTLFLPNIPGGFDSIDREVKKGLIELLLRYSAVSSEGIESLLAPKGQEARKRKDPFGDSDTDGPSDGADVAPRDTKTARTGGMDGMDGMDLMDGMDACLDTRTLSTLGPMQP